MAATVDYVTGQDVATFIGRGSDSDFVNGPARLAADLATGAASSYVRGVGFDDFEAIMPASLYFAVLMRAIRIVGNLQQLSSESRDGVSMNYGAGGSGWTVHELLALDEYRRTACSI